MIFQLLSCHFVAAFDGAVFVVLLCFDKLFALIDLSVGDVDVDGVVDLLLHPSSTIIIS